MEDGADLPVIPPPTPTGSIMTNQSKINLLHHLCNITLDCITSTEPTTPHKPYVLAPVC